MIHIYKMSLFIYFNIFPKGIQHTNTIQESINIKSLDKMHLVYDNITLYSILLNFPP